jgi:hypothetical protein
MWMATTTSRITFLQSDAIVPVMDAITRGWRYGRGMKNLYFEKWDALFEEQLELVQLRSGLARGGSQASATPGCYWVALDFGAHHWKRSMVTHQYAGLFFAQDFSCYLQDIL